jgi:hypothetical protein
MMAGQKPSFTDMKTDAAKENSAACLAARNQQTEALAQFSIGAGGKEPVLAANKAVAENCPPEQKKAKAPAKSASAIRP